MKHKTVPVGKGSLRVRGEYVYGLYILADKEIELIRVPKALLDSQPDLAVRDAMLDIVRLMVSQLIFDATGIRPIWPSEPVVAPDSEREKPKDS